jgi:hypothetical protein
MFVLDLFQGAVVLVAAAIAWGIVAWIAGAIMAGWVASQAGREFLVWLVLGLFLSPPLALIALAALPPVTAADGSVGARAHERRLKAVNSL